MCADVTSVTMSSALLDARRRHPVIYRVYFPLRIQARTFTTEDYRMNDVRINGSRIRLNVAHIAASFCAGYIIRPPFAQRHAMSLRWSVKLSKAQPEGSLRVIPSIFTTLNIIRCLISVLSKVNQTDII